MTLGEEYEMLHRRIKDLEAELADMKRKWEKSERWRKAYQDGKSKLYAMEGAIAEAAMECLPCNEGVLDQWFRKEYVHRDALDTANMALAAERARLAEVTANAERYLYIRTESLIHWETGKKRNRISWPTLYAADPSHEGTYRDRFDAAIDAAMKEAQ